MTATMLNQKNGCSHGSTKKTREITTYYMTTDDIPFQVHLDLIERQLQQCLEDVKQMRQDETRKKAVKARCIILRAALGNARHYLREFEESLEAT